MERGGRTGSATNADLSGKQHQRERQVTSHISKIDLVVTDLSALQKACERLGAVWLQDKKTYTWFGQSVGDYPLPQGMTKADLGKCSHAIKLPGVNYEIGVVKLKDGSGYALAYDFYGYDGSTHDGHKLKAKFGEGLEKIKQLYAVTKATLTAKAKGWSVLEKQLPNGSVRLQMIGM